MRCATGRTTRRGGPFHSQPQAAAAILTGDFNFRADDPLRARIEAPFDDPACRRSTTPGSACHPGVPHAPTQRRPRPRAVAGAVRLRLRVRDPRPARAPARDRGRRGDAGVGPPADPRRARRRLRSCERIALDSFSASEATNGSPRLRCCAVEEGSQLPSGAAMPTRRVLLASLVLAGFAAVPTARAAGSLVDVRVVDRSRGGHCRRTGFGASSTSPAGPATATRCK